MTRSFLPLALITIGVVFLLGNVVPERGRGGLVVVGLGAAFAIGRLTTGRYGYAIPAGILIGIGAFISLQDIQGLFNLSGGGAFFILLGLGFALAFAIGLRPGAIWPLFPAAILIGLGLVLLGVSSLDPLASLSWIAAYWPVALVLLGVWLMFREALPPPIRRPIATLGGLALLAYGIVAAAASVAAGGTLARAGVAPGFASAPFGESVTGEAPIAAGQTFSVTNSSGQTTIRGGAGSTVHVVATRRGRPASDVRLVSTSNGVSLDESSGGFPFRSADYVIDVPAGVAVNAQSSSGSISITGVTGPVQAKTSSGSINVSGVFTEASEISASSGSVTLRLLPGTAIQLDVHTGSGSVNPSGGLALSGGVTRRDTLTGAIGAPAPGATLSVQTSSGSVSISQ